MSSKDLCRPDYVAGPSYASTLWSPEWLREHSWGDEAEPAAPRVAEVCLTGPAGTGKTRNVLEWLHRQLLDHPRCRVLLCRAYRNDLTQGPMKTFEQEVLPERAFGGSTSGAPVRFHGEQGAYLYDNGSELVVKGLRDSQGIYSQQYDHVYVNEAGSDSINEADWDQLKRAKRNRRTPYSILLGDMNAEYEMHWLHQRCDDGATVEIRTSHADNPAAGAAYLHDLATIRDPIQRERLFLGHRVSYKPGAYYQESLALARAEGRICRVPHQPGLPVHTAWDLGWSDYTAIWFFQRVRGEWHFIDYYEDRLRDLDHYTSVLSRKAIERKFTYGRHCLPHDARAKTLAAGGKSVQRQLRALGVQGIVVPPTDEQAQLNAVRAALPLCWFDDATWTRPKEGESHREGARWGVQRLAGFHPDRDERRDVFRPTPAHDINSHGAKAFATGVLAAPGDSGARYDRGPSTDAHPWLRVVR